jgi:hypothetical protein
MLQLVAQSHLDFRAKVLLGHLLLKVLHLLLKVLLHRLLELLRRHQR